MVRFSSNNYEESDLAIQMLGLGGNAPGELLREAVEDVDQFCEALAGFLRPEIDTLRHA